MLVSGLLAGAVLALQAPLLPALPRVPLPKVSAGAVRAIANTNHSSAGARSGGVVNLTIDVVTSAMHPEGETDPEVPILAFAERGGAPLVPGPLLRVPQGTAVHLTLTNKSDSAVTIGGFRPAFRPRTIPPAWLPAPRASSAIAWTPPAPTSTGARWEAPTGRTGSGTTASSTAPSWWTRPVVPPGTTSS